MYSERTHRFEPVPTDRELTVDERKWTKFAVDEIVYVKGMSFRVLEIQPRKLVLVPIEPPRRPF